MKETLINKKVERIVFHFNKAHNADPHSIPAWIVKCRGKTYYVHTMTSQVGFSTKETPDNEHTKAALQFKGLLTIVEHNDGSVEALIK